MNLSYYLRTPAAAQFLGLGESTLEKWRLTGIGPKFSRLGRAVVYALPDLQEFVGERRTSSTSEADAIQHRLPAAVPTRPAQTTGKRRGRPSKAAKVAG
ncbi:MAG: helix-turn-helix domain-containing protein [Magnetococcales bacterium]|nr:helix-turn-helix domain-containing protein [Magnetococcales bacterium]